jgi:hypothetical protein
MNKLLLKLGLVVALSMMAASAYATNEVTATVIGGGSFNPSTNVKIFASAIDSTYNAVSGHLQGDRNFGASNAAPSILYKAKDKGTATTATDCPTNSTAFDSSWSSL